MLVSSGYKDHIIHTLVAIGAKAYLVRRAVAPDVATAIAHLTQIRAQLPEAIGLYVLKVVLGGARSTLGSLYPEPGATSVKDELVRLMLTSEVDRGKDLNVEKVTQVLL